MKIKAIIADDEALSREELKYLLKDYNVITIVGEAEDGTEAIELSEKLKPDLIFLDIQMPGKSGLSVAKELIRTEKPPLIVFATAFDQHAIEAFEMAAIDYLLKPFSAERLKKTLDRIAEKFIEHNQGENLNKMEEILIRVAGRPKGGKAVKRLTVEENGRVKLISPQEVSCAFVEERIVFLKAEDEQYKTNYSLQELEEKLDKPPFFRCHRSYLVNLEWISEIHPWFNGAYQLTLKDKDKTEVPVSRLAVKELKDALDI